MYHQTIQFVLRKILWKECIKNLQKDQPNHEVYIYIYVPGEKILPSGSREVTEQAKSTYLHSLLFEKHLRNKREFLSNSKQEILI